MPSSRLRTRTQKPKQIAPGHFVCGNAYIIDAAQIHKDDNNAEDPRAEAEVDNNAEETTTTENDEKGGEEGSLKP